MNNDSNKDHACLVWTRAAGLLFPLLAASPVFAQETDPSHGGWIEDILASLARLEAQAQDQAAQAERKVLTADRVIRQSKEALVAAEAAGDSAARDIPPARPSIALRPP